MSYASILAAQRQKNMNITYWLISPRIANCFELTASLTFILIIYPRMKAVDLNLTYVRRQKILKGYERVFQGRCVLNLYFNKGTFSQRPRLFRLNVALVIYLPKT